jgi:type VI secretion system secreted protein Hcp
MSTNKASPLLFLACATGQHIKKAILYARKAGGEQQDYMKWTFSDVLCSSWQESGSAHGESLPIESISLNFAKIEVEYKPQKPDGSLDAAMKAGYDCKKQTKV